MNFYLTDHHDCSYLDNQQASTLFLDPDVEMGVEIYQQLNNHGFRRSGAHYYRPHCKSCRGCISTRLNINEFQPSRSQKRIARKNIDLKAIVVDNEFSEEHWLLYQDYINTRHKDGDMYPADLQQYKDFLCRENDFSFRIELRQKSDNKLLSVAIIDQLLDGLSAIYTFFDPNEAKRSLGVQSILTQYNLAKQMDLPWLYLGYFVPNCRKMDYKQQYQPLQYLCDEEWQDEAPDDEWVFQPRPDLIKAEQVE
jgi:leucyl-tRNA---protein transferase